MGSHTGKMACVVKPNNLIWGLGKKKRGVDASRYPKIAVQNMQYFIANKGRKY